MHKCQSCADVQLNFSKSSFPYSHHLTMHFFPSTSSVHASIFVVLALASFRYYYLCWTVCICCADNNNASLSHPTRHTTYRMQPRHQTDFQTNTFNVKLIPARDAWFSQSILYWFSCKIRNNTIEYDVCRSRRVYCSLVRLFAIVSARQHDVSLHPPLRIICRIVSLRPQHRKERTNDNDVIVGRNKIQCCIIWS